MTMHCNRCNDEREFELTGRSGDGVSVFENFQCRVCFTPKQVVTPVNEYNKQKEVVKEEVKEEPAPPKKKTTRKRSTKK